MVVLVNWRDIVSAKKSIDDAGAWSSGPIPRSAFPLSRSGNRAYRPGNRRWRALRFRVHGLECRLLITLSLPLEDFRADLGVLENGDMKVLAALEFHGTHGDWHAHVREADIAAISPGFRRGPDVVRLEPPPGFGWTGFGLDEQRAYKVTVDFFRLDRTGAGNDLGLEP